MKANAAFARCFAFFFFSLPFSLCNHNEQADKTGRVSLSFSLSLFNWFRSLLSFSRVLLFSVVACSRLAACFARFVNAVRLECNSSFLLVIFIHGTPSATQPLLFFFFLVLYFPLGFFSPYIVNDSFFLLSSISLSFTRATTPCFFLFAPRTPTPVKKKKVSFSFFLHTSQT